MNTFSGAGCELADTLEGPPERVELLLPGAPELIGTLCRVDQLEARRDGDGRDLYVLMTEKSALATCANAGRLADWAKAKGAISVVRMWTGEAL